MNNIRYEPVFGDQTLFNDGPDDAEMVAIYASRLKRWYKLQDGECYLYQGKGQSWKRCRNGYPGFTLLAQRRIIRVPIWIKADQQAGRLPEVGAFFLARGCRWECVRILVDIVLAVSGESFHGFQFDDCQPIETLEERQQREREEWIQEVTRKFYPKGHKDFPETIYDALLSGELKIPEVKKYGLYR